MVWEAFQKVKGRSQGQSVWNNEWKSLVSGKSRAGVLNILAQMILCYGGCPGIVGYLAASLVSTYEMPVISKPLSPQVVKTKYVSRLVRHVCKVAPLLRTVGVGDNQR